MTKRKKFTIAVGVLLAVALVAGISFAVAASTYGSESDPLVTMSYINDTVKPGIQSQIDASISSAKSDLSAQFDEKLANAGGDTNTFTVVTLSSGQTVICGAGSEIILRSGSAVSAGPDSPCLMDTTDGTSLSSSGIALTANHLYMVGIAANGMQATSAGTKVLVRGHYTVS